MTSWYNENDAFPAQWLENLCAAGHIPWGTVDTRSILDLKADDIPTEASCHFFAGIGGWPLALRMAGWPDDKPVWTGSCPCQPFSVAGKRKGTADERHLWPIWRELIAECRPPTIFGEQVASADGRLWLAGVRADLEALGYAVGAADLCAASVGAPHIRQRLYWVAHAERDTGEPWRASGQPTEGDGAPGAGSCVEFGRRGDVRLANADGRLESDRDVQRSREHGQWAQDTVASGMGYAESIGREQWRSEPNWWSASSANLSCLDERSRRIPIEPSFQPLAHGVPARVGRLRAYGNAIVPEVAAAFIRSVM